MEDIYKVLDGLIYMLYIGGAVAMYVVIKNLIKLFKDKPY